MPISQSGVPTAGTSSPATDAAWLWRLAPSSAPSPSPSGASGSMEAEGGNRSAWESKFQ